jgi:3-oxoacyl-[acyl-carrier-protein] synthase-3
MDIKNACNSVLNAMQVADHPHHERQYRQLLIASGEQPSRRALQRGAVPAVPSFTMSDGERRASLERSGDTFESSARLSSQSRATGRIGTLGTGGWTRTPRTVATSMDGPALQQAFLDLGPDAVLVELELALRSGGHPPALPPAADLRTPSASPTTRRS